MRAYERLLKYVTVDTTSSETSETSPSTQRQFDLARMLCEELRTLGVEDACLSETCYVYGHLPATPGYEDKPTLGFIAHVDTVPDFSGEGVKPRLIENYDGADVELGHGLTLTNAQFPHLSSLAGRTLIVASGDTLLGADDKAGVAEIMTLIERLTSSDMPHSRIAVCFTPDEEVGHGTDNFDMELFGADAAYTLDGGPEGEITCENFNACSAEVSFKGVNVHTGSAKDVMVNAALVAMEFNSMLPAGQIPRCTEEREGFYHLTHVEGECSAARSQYILRDHDAAKLEMRRETMLHAAKCLNEKYGEGTVIVTLRDGYKNMIDKILPDHAWLIENAKTACTMAGVEPFMCLTRGGTDGAVLSWMGLPCPNLGTGGYAFHGPYEHITVEGMDKCVEIALNIVALNR